MAKLHGVWLNIRFGDHHLMGVWTFGRIRLPVLSWGVNTVHSVGGEFRVKPGWQWFKVYPTHG